MNNSFEYITTLEYRLKAVSHEVAAFKSGENIFKWKSITGVLLENLNQK